MKVLEYRLEQAISTLTMDEALTDINTRIDDLVAYEYVQMSAFLHPGRGCINIVRTITEIDGTVEDMDTRYFQPPQVQCCTLLQTL